MALARAKAYLPELDLVALVGRFPEFEIDGSVFLEEDFATCVRETCPLSTLLADELDLVKYQPAYSMENKHIHPPKDNPFELVPPCRKKSFAPNVDTLVIVPADSNFIALSTIQLIQEDLETQ